MSHHGEVRMRTDDPADWREVVLQANANNDFIADKGEDVVP